MRLFLIGSQLFYTFGHVMSLQTDFNNIIYSITFFKYLCYDCQLPWYYPKSDLPSITHSEWNWSNCPTIHNQAPVLPRSYLTPWCFTVSMTDQWFKNEWTSFDLTDHHQRYNRPIGLLLNCTIILFLIEEGGWRWNRMTVTLFYECNWKLFNS